MQTLRYLTAHICHHHNLYTHQQTQYAHIKQAGMTPYNKIQFLANPSHRQEYKLFAKQLQKSQ